MITFAQANRLNTKMKLNRLTLLAIIIIMWSGTSCQDKAQRVVNDAIEVHGGPAFKSFVLEFDFRDRHYTAARDKGVFSYSREFSDSTGNIKDVLDNNGFTRYRNGTAVTLPAEREQAFTRSVNSVIYFMLLPFGLNDDAVRKEWIQETVIRDQRYHQVRVTFDQAGGGEDHEDEFLYWFHTEKKTMDYFAYSYKTEGGGMRFREAINPRRAGGILLQDYVNYKPDDESIPLDSLRAMFIAGTLKRLSEIRLENITVSEYDR
jgi:hypothetical protein